MISPDDLTRVHEFESFLKDAELAQTAVSQPPQPFGNWFRTYADSNVQVRIVQDRDQLWIEIGNPEHPSEWADAAIVRDALGECGPDELSIGEQISIVTTHWVRIRESCAARALDATRRKLAECYEKRRRRLFPDLET